MVALKFLYGRDLKVIIFLEVLNCPKLNFHSKQPSVLFQTACLHEIAIDPGKPSQPIVCVSVCERGRERERQREDYDFFYFFAI